MTFDTFTSKENPYRESPFRTEYAKGDSLYDVDDIYEPDFNDFVQELFEEAQNSLVNATESLDYSQSFSPNGEDSVVNNFANQYYVQLAPALEQSIQDFSNYLGDNIGPNDTDEMVFGIIECFKLCSA